MEATTPIPPRRGGASCPGGKDGGGLWLGGAPPPPPFPLRGKRGGRRVCQVCPLSAFLPPPPFAALLTSPPPPRAARTPPITVPHLEPFCATVTTADTTAAAAVRAAITKVALASRRSQIGGSAQPWRREYPSKVEPNSSLVPLYEGSPAIPSTGVQLRWIIPTLVVDFG